VEVKAILWNRWRRRCGKRLVFLFLPAAIAIITSIPGSGSQGPASSGGLQPAIDCAVPSPAVSYLLWDLNSDKILASRWDHFEEPIAIGSLIKPFTAVAYLQSTREPFPRYICYGTQSSCWLPHGHGKLGIETAIEESCNAYFLSLAHEIPYETASKTFAHFGLPPFERDSMARTLTGLSRSWRIQPLQVVTAYAQLLREAHQDDRMKDILYGMKLSAARGTGKALAMKVPEVPVLAKTGTAACSHLPRATADGFTVALFPAEEPRMLLLVRVHGATGATSAATAGSILALVERGGS
jgi:cell division protein FtsI/penicillin-binding protein 2